METNSKKKNQEAYTTAVLETQRTQQNIKESEYENFIHLKSRLKREWI